MASGPVFTAALMLALGMLSIDGVTNREGEVHTHAYPRHSGGGWWLFHISQWGTIGHWYAAYGNRDSSG